MLSLISFILVCIGSINWFCIGILQFDFVAGIFGSQSNIFSRLIYTLVGVASIIVIANFVTNKGRFVVSFKKANKEFKSFQEEKQLEKKRALATESSEDFSINNEHKESYTTNTSDKKCDCNKEHCEKHNENSKKQS